MNCDLCGLPMDDDETGIFLVKLGKGGHIACARKEAINANQVQRY